MSQLPNFPPFTVHNNEQSAGIRWRKWVEKFENLICALDISDDKRKKAMLLHYVGEETYDIYDSFTDDQKGIGAMTGEGELATSNEFNVLKQSLTEYFTPKKNTSYEVFKFRQANQNVGETIDSYHTRLRSLASTCDFHDTDREILSQIIQGCTSCRIRRRTLRDNYTLEKVLSEARALELSESRATEMETGAAQANAVYKPNRKYQSADKPVNFPKKKHNKKGKKPNHNPKSGGAQGDSVNNASQCRNCGGNISHKVCPAFGQECHFCKKKNHFIRVCRARLNAKQVNCATESHQNHDCYQNANDSSSDKSVFNIDQNNVKVPSVHASVHGTDIEFLVDTGASVNIISENVFRSMCGKSKISLQKPVPLIYAYGSSDPLNVKGYFHAEIRYRKKTAHANFYVVESARQSRCLLGATTAQNLNIVQFAFTSLSNSFSDEHAPLFDGKMGKIEGIKVKLHINQDVTPVSQRHRRIPFHVRKDVEAELERLEALDVIESVSGPTPWVRPVVVVPKKSSGVRVCIDMREANKAISREKHPMPTVDDLITDLNSSTVFSKLDLSNAYHQLELDESSRYITTFSTHVGLKRYKRLLFGVNAASEIFQKVIADLLSQSDHDKALKMTLDRLQAKGARLNKDKCIFSVNKITFFGHVFSDTGVSPDPEKIKCIVGKEAPKNPNEVRSFLGMTQYVSRFIPHYATITEPLRRLTRKDNAWYWSRNEQDAFEKLKLALSSTEVMVYFNPDLPTEVIVDASPVGVAAMLTQKGKVVSYVCRALTDIEQRYSQTDREMLAVVYGVEHFHLYLFASEFKVITDHKPLLGIVHSQKPASARIERWRLRLMPYEFKLEYSGFS